MPSAKSAAKPNPARASDLADGSDDDAAGAGLSGQGKTQRIAKGQPYQHSCVYWVCAKIHFFRRMQHATNAGSRRASASPRRTRATRASPAHRRGQVRLLAGSHECDGS